jgi:O-antigen/teichoic acid export membrane protein
MLLRVGRREWPLSRLRTRTIAAALPLANSPIMRRLASGGFWSLSGDAGARTFAFASAIVAARWLGVADFGAFVLVQSTLGMLTTFASFGMGLTSTRFIAAYRNDEPHRIESTASLSLWFSILTGFLAAVVLFGVAPIVATKILAAPQLEGPLRMAAPVLFLYAVSGALSGTILGFESFQRLTHMVWLASFVNFLAIVVGVSISGFQGAVLGLVASEAARCAILIRLAQTVMRENGFRLFARANLSESKMIWQFSLPVLMGALLHAPIMWVCQAIIARQTRGMVEIGLFDAAQKWMTVVILVPMAASAAVGPVMANMSGNSDRSLFRKTATELALVQFAITAISATLVASAAPLAVQIFGEGFAAASSVVVIMMLLAPIYVLRHLAWQILTAGGRAWATLWLGVLWAVVVVALSWKWQSSGATALAEAMLIAYGVALGASIVLVKQFWRGVA